MHEMTEQNLKAAFAGESQAHMKYSIFAEVAEKEGRKNIAKLFRAVAFAEKVHATNHLRALGNIKKTPENLDVAIAGENFEVNEMYPAYMQEAISQGEKDAEKSMHYALEAEKIHADMYEKAKTAAKSDTDINVGSIHICSVCGYTVENESPDFCPICGAKSQAFNIFK